MEIKSCVMGDKEYHEALRFEKSTPKILYYAGDISLCGGKVIAVIGRRDAVGKSYQNAEQIGALLAREGYVILNGLARRVDADVSSGTMYTAEQAIKHGKLVGRITGREGVEVSAGNRVLIESGRAEGIANFEELKEFVQRDDCTQISMFDHIY